MSNGEKFDSMIADIYSNLIDALIIINIIIYHYLSYLFRVNPWLHSWDV